MQNTSAVLAIGLALAVGMQTGVAASSAAAAEILHSETGTHGTNLVHPHIGSGKRRGQVPLAAHGSSAAEPSARVIDTIDLLNNSVHPGNFLAGNSIGPVTSVFDVGRGVEYVGDYGSSDIVLISDQNGSILGRVPVGGFLTGIAYDSNRGEIFVTSSTTSSQGSVSVVSDTTNSVVASIPVGGQPNELMYDPGRSELFLTYQYSENVSIISDTLDKIVANTSLGTIVRAMAYDEGAGEVFMTTTSGPYAAGELQAISDSSLSVTSTTPVGYGSFGVAFDPVRNDIYVANEDSGNVSVVSAVTDRVVATVPIGTLLSNGAPQGVVYDSGKGLTFVSHDNGNVSVISDSSNTVIATVSTGVVSLGPDAESAMSYDGSRGKVFVPHEFLDTVNSINDTTYTLAPSTSLGYEPYGVAYDAGRNELFIANSGSNNVTIVSASTDRIVGSVQVKLDPEQLAYDPSHGEVFVTDPDGVSVISDTTNTVVAYIPLVTDLPQGVTYDSGTGEVFVTEDTYNGNVTVISDVTNSVVSTIPVGREPVAALYDSSKGEVFVADLASDEVSVISDTEGRVVSNVAVGGFPVGMSYDAGRGEVLVATQSTAYLEGDVAVISDTNDSLIASIPTSYPIGIGYDPASDQVLLAVIGSTVEELSLETDTTTGTFTVGERPEAFTFDPVNSLIYLTNSLQGTVSIVEPVTYSAWFNESGLPSGSTWTLTISGFSRLTSTGPGQVVNLLNGSYSYSVACSLAHFVAPGGSFNVSGAGLSIPILFNETFSVTFAETGLPAGTRWSVTLNDGYNASVTTSIGFIEPNGSVRFAIGNVSGYVSTPETGVVHVNGGPVVLNATFVMPQSESGFLGLSGTEITYMLFGGIGTAIAAVAGLLLTRRRERKPPEISSTLMLGNIPLIPETPRE